MNKEIPSEEQNGLDDSSAIETDETLEIGRIELNARGDGPIAHLGWPLVTALEDECRPVLDTQADDIFDHGQAGQPSTESMLQPPDGGPEPLRLAAEIAALRHQATAREQSLEAELAGARELIASKESELAQRAALIASLTLECCRLRAAAAGRPQQTVDAGLSRDGDTRWNLRHLFSRVRGTAEPTEAVPLNPESSRAESGQAAAYAGEPDMEVATLAIERPPAAAVAVDPPTAAERAARRECVLEKVRLDRRRQMVEHAGAERRGEVAGQPALRRYLIGLEPDRNEVHEITRSRMYVGRGAEADLRLGDATVSRLHSVISVESGLTAVEDTSSTNGVFVNSRRIRRIVLRDGDKVAFGTVLYQYRIGPTAPQND